MHSRSRKAISSSMVEAATRQPSLMRCSHKAVVWTQSQSQSRCATRLWPRCPFGRHASRALACLTSHRLCCTSSSISDPRCIPLLLISYPPVMGSPVSGASPQCSKVYAFLICVCCSTRLNVSYARVRSKLSSRRGLRLVNGRISALLSNVYLVIPRMLGCGLSCYLRCSLYAQHMWFYGLHG